jgi:hypothetical protein
MTRVMCRSSARQTERRRTVNLDTDDPVGARNRAILFGLVTLVVIGAIVGLGVGWLGSRAVDSTGIDEVEAPPGDGGSSEDPFEDFTASPSESEDTDATEPTEPTETVPTTPTEPTETREPREPTLNASPLTATTFEQVYLTGRFPGLGAGVALQVERREGGVWTEFPVDTTTDPRGTYSTYVQTGHTGPNRFRITAETGESTPIVVVQIV